MKSSRSFIKWFHALRVLSCMGLFISQLAWAPDAISAVPVYCMVNAAAAGANSGASWADAFTDLQSALGTSACSEIWVAAGTYRPSPGYNRAATFRLKDGVALYGGFEGSETSREQRDPAAHPTILSGDLKGNDSGFANNAENSYHVVTGASGAILDGFTIRSGNANGNAPDNYGGGMYNEYGSPALTDVTFRGNFALVCGGGMANRSGGSPTLTGVTFDGNIASPGFSNGFGGGLYNEESSPVLVQVTFTANLARGPAGRGGGMYSYGGSPALTDVTFSGNTATNDGGGLYNENSSPALVNVTFNINTAARNGGGMYSTNGSPTLTNVTFSGNAADYYGGGIWNSSGNPILTNITFSGNTAGSWGGGLYSDASTPQIRNTIFWGNTAEGGGAQIGSGGKNPLVSYSVIQGGCPMGATCAHILTADPHLGILGDHGGFTPTLPLQPGSSALDAGNDLTCAATDQRGILRPQGAHCDIGAFEYFSLTILGNAGVAGATLTYPGGVAIAADDGNYTFTVPYYWSGTLTPSMAGYSFVPQQREYLQVTTDLLDQDFTAALNSYTISGNAGAAGAILTYTGGVTLAAEDGDYSFAVPYGWSGTLTPSLAGHTFDPPQRDYLPVSSDLLDQDFTAALNSYTISGNAGVAGALLTYAGGTTTAGADGNYSFTVTHGWSGTLIPSLAGYTFNPPLRDYLPVTSDQVAQDFTAALIKIHLYLPLILR